MSSWLVILLALLSPIPIAADLKVRRRPWVTYLLIAVNTAVYLITQPDRSADPSVLFNQWGVVPDHPTAVTLVTSLFVHTGLLHLFFNMLFLWVFGPLVENAIGPITFIVLYLGGGLLSALLQTAIVLQCAHHSAAFASLSTVPLVGASGAISAVLAPFAIRYHRSRIRLLWLPAYLLRSPFGDLQVRSVFALYMWLAVNLYGGIRGIAVPESGGVAYWAHIGGFVFGLVTAALTGLYIEGRQEYLLVDARAAAARGRSGDREAVDKYRAYLEFDPKNVSVRLELAQALAGIGNGYGDDSALEQASAELSQAFKHSADSGNLRGAVEAASTAQTAGVALDLSARERLRLATAAQTYGDTRTAVTLLEGLLAGDHNQSEDEMARLRLGQLLAKVDPSRAADVLGDMIRKYPDSDWIRQARQLLAQVQSHR
jgi:membrane associated rhomboid family serine protease